MRDFLVRFRLALLALALVLTPTSLVRADADYWRELIESARDAGRVRVLEVGSRTPLNERPAEFTAELLGPVADLGATRGALIWQLGGLWDDDGGLAGDFGLHYRFPPSGARSAGVNVFADYYRRKHFGAFWRWSAGGEFRSPWMDIFANYYFPFSSERRGVLYERGPATMDGMEPELVGRDVLLKVAEGYDAEFRLHMPEHRWFSAVGGWARWNRAGENGDDRGGIRYGIRLEPTAEEWDNIRIALLRDESRPEGHKTRLNFSLYFTVGEGWEFARADEDESIRRHFQPAQRERRPFLRESD